jgi:hypothetical protein
LDVGGESGPVERGRNCLHGLANAKVSIDNGVVVLSEDPLLEGRHVGDVELTWLVRGSPVKESVVKGVVRGVARGNGSHNRGDVRVRIVGLLDGCHKVGIKSDERDGGEVGATAQGVGHNVGLAGLVLDGDVVILEVLHPSGLASG